MKIKYFNTSNLLSKFQSGANIAGFILLIKELSVIAGEYNRFIRPLKDHP
jgi:hypothetical protein